MVLPLLEVTTWVLSFDTIFSPTLPPLHLNMYFNTVDGSFAYDCDVDDDDDDDDVVVEHDLVVTVEMDDLDWSHSFIR